MPFKLRMILSSEASHPFKNCQSKCDRWRTMACRFHNPSVRSKESGLGLCRPPSAQAWHLRSFFIYALHVLPDESWDSSEGLFPMCVYRGYHQGFGWYHRMDRTH
jgi:hypothetical protein